MKYFEQIRFEVADQIAMITLFRPDRLNAFTRTMCRELVEAFDRTDADDNIRAVIVTGAGDRAFCAGADLSSGAETFVRGGGDKSEQQDIPLDEGGIAALRIYQSKKPVIGAINGAAVGIGATLTLPMDIRLASTSARFGFVFARRGLVPEAGSSWFLPRVVGISRALEWCYSGRMVSAHEACSTGLVRKLYRPDELIPVARAVARTFTELTSPVSITLTRQMLWRMLSVDDPIEALRTESRALYLLGTSRDVQEGIESFLEKRTAQFLSRVSTDVPDVFQSQSERDLE